jgi:hypothetical protein
MYWQGLYPLWWIAGILNKLLLSSSSSSSSLFKIIWNAHPLSVPSVQNQNLYTSACNWHKMYQALHKCVSLYVLRVTVHRLKPGYLPLTYLCSPWRWPFGLKGGRAAITEPRLTVSVYSDGYTITYSQFVQGQKCNIRQHIHFFIDPKYFSCGQPSWQ